MIRVLIYSLVSLYTILSLAADDYALDDAHNHDGTHIEGQENCGGNYMFPGDIARLGSHSFLVLGEDGPEHLILDHRSGTPPHTYQFLLRVRVDASEMATYRRLLKESKKSLPAVTTIYFDKSGKQVDRTFFCLHDLPKIFGSEAKAGDAFEKLFPIRATWQKDADFEGAFPIKETITPDDPLVIERKDVELLVYRYLPSYLEQKGFRSYLKAHPEFISHLSDAPQKHDEPIATASHHRSYVTGGAFDSNGETCPSNYYLKTVRPPKTRHAFVILATQGDHTLLATHLYDQAPQNYQTTIQFEVSDSEMKTIKPALAKGLLLFWPSNYFCMADIRSEIKNGLKLSGDLYANSNLTEFDPGQKIGSMEPTRMTVLVNRPLQSLMNPQAVARDVFGFVDVRTVNPKIRVEGRYASAWNFLGRPVKGYRVSRCYLSAKAATALSAVEKDVEKKGYNLLAFDCYRPQRAVDEFVSWVKSGSDSSTKSFFYPGEDRTALIKRGYIDGHSGHSRGSTIDLTLVRADSALKSFHETYLDCRKPSKVEGQVDMGTAFDCFSEVAYTADKSVSSEAKANRVILREAMEKHGFKNYPKEWWHFVLNDEPYKAQYFDFEVQ
jgi:D-alanyl-D-alanine dipeptidase